MTKEWSPKFSFITSSIVYYSVLAWNAGDRWLWQQKIMSSYKPGEMNGITYSVSIPPATPTTNRPQPLVPLTVTYPIGVFEVYWLMFACIDEEGHQYIEIGYWFAHLMLRAQALKLIDDGRNTPVDGSPAPPRTPSDNRPSAELKKAHMSAISQLSTKILQRARRVETSEIRVRTPLSPPHFLAPSLNSFLLVDGNNVVSTSPTLYTL